jgi:hypothetical protein
VCQLKKSLYGLKQVPRARYAKMEVLYVDDLLIKGSSTSVISLVKDILHDQFSITDMGPLKFFLILKINEDALGINLSQTKYVLWQTTTHLFSSLVDRKLGTLLVFMRSFLLYLFEFLLFDWFAYNYVDIFIIFVSELFPLDIIMNSLIIESKFNDNFSC